MILVVVFGILKLLLQKNAEVQKIQQFYALILKAVFVKMELEILIMMIAYGLKFNFN
jgi:hypothetical protein